jgi:predicted protein tyrosine phosphatase
VRLEFCETTSVKARLGRGGVTHLLGLPPGEFEIDGTGVPLADWLTLPMIDIGFDDGARLAPKRADVDDILGFTEQRILPHPAPTILVHDGAHGALARAVGAGIAARRAQARDEDPIDAARVVLAGRPVNPLLMRHFDEALALDGRLAALAD